MLRLCQRFELKEVESVNKVGCCGGSLMIDDDVDPLDLCYNNAFNLEDIERSPIH